MWGQKDDYLDNMIQISPGKQKAQLSASRAQRQVQKQIRNGSMIINKSQTIDNHGRIARLSQLDQDVLKKKAIIKQEMKDLDKEVIANQEMLRKAKREISIAKYASHEANKEYEERKKRQIAIQVQKWTHDQDELNSRHQLEQDRRQMRRQEKEEKGIQEKNDREELLKLQRRQQIEQRIKDMEIKKYERERRLHEIPRSMSTHATMPRYLVAERNFRQKQIEKEFQMQLERHKVKERLAIDPEQLKAHERAYIERIKERLNMKPKKKVRDDDSDDKVKSQFNLYLNRKDDKLQEEMQKMKRRQKFQERIAKIPLNVNEKKKIQREISVDKANHPYKYNFLSQKSLNEEQIYKQFKDFEMKSDPRKLGKSYLEELKAKPRLRVSKSTVIKREDLPSTDRPSYKNYLQEVKVKRLVPLSEIQATKKHYRKNPQLAKEALNQKSQEYEGKALKKIKDLKNAANYEESLKKENQIDDMFFKSLETKIAAAQFS